MLIPSLRMIRESGMGQPYSQDLRERVVGAIEGGMSTGKAAKRFCVSKAAAGAWARLKRATGSVAPAQQGKPPGSVLDAHADFIFEVLKDVPDTTLEEMAERLAQERGVKVVYTAVWKFLDRRGFTHKKRPLMRASKSAPT
jgi:transposase